MSALISRSEESSESRVEGGQRDGDDEEREGEVRSVSASKSGDGERDFSDTLTPSNRLINYVLVVGPGKGALEAIPRQIASNCITDLAIVFPSNGEKIPCKSTHAKQMHHPWT